MPLADARLIHVHAVGHDNIVLDISFALPSRKGGGDCASQPGTVYRLQMIVQPTDLLPLPMHE